MTRDATIIELAHWLATPPGRYLLQWEQRQLDAAVVDLFGYHALQLGLPQLDALRANRMPHRWVASDLSDLSLLVARAATDEPAPVIDDTAPLEAPLPAVDLANPPPPPAPIVLQSEFDSLPFPAQSLDLVVLPHALEFARDSHQALREVERVLVPEGRVVIVGLNPASLWGADDAFSRLRRRLGWSQAVPPVPHAGELLGYRRLRDWLRLLGLEVERGRFGCWRPPLAQQRWLDRLAWMESTGERWWPVFGAVYFVVAVKRVRGMRLIGLARNDKAKSKAAAPAVATHRQRESVHE